METVNLQSCGPCPDLLKRFVQTPFRGTIQIGGKEVLIESNDPAVLEALGPLKALSATPQAFHWKLIYDCGISSQLDDATSIACGPVFVLNLGPACFMGVDYERNELVAFLGITADRPAFRKTILPLLTNLTLRNLMDASIAGRGFEHAVPIG
jgi:hypothetical protein